METILANKKIFAILIVWTMINLVFLYLSSESDFYKSDLWPITENGLLETYDKTEFFLYVFGPVIVGIFSILTSQKQRAR